MTQYSFTTSFTLQASQKEIWPVLINYHTWPVWWKGIKKIAVNEATISPSIAVALGFPWYQLSIVLHVKEIHSPDKIVFLSTGDLVGIGTFTLKTIADETEVVFDWDVATTKLWMNLSAPFLRPFFEHSHNLVMKWFVHGLSKKLKTKIRAEHYITD